MIKRYKRTDGAIIVAKPTTHHTGEQGLYGCDANLYERNGDFSCGARYYFGTDLDQLTALDDNGGAS